jgi:hypothetical protein
MDNNTPLDAAVTRLTKFRQSWNPDDQICGECGLTAEDLDRVLARLAETAGASPVREMRLSDHDATDPAPQWFERADRLSDTDVVGEHGAMQDGVHDHRKDALAGEIERRGLDV